MAGQVSATSWVESGIHLRVYRSHQDQITERCWDTDTWYNGAFSARGVTVGATSWLDGSNQIHIRVYVGNGSGGPITEHCWDTDSWYAGAFQGSGTGATAVSWFDGQTHIRVYVRDQHDNVTEHCWDGSGPWYNGAYTE
jgi:Fungal fucose-specific lectin